MEELSYLGSGKGKNEIALFLLKQSLEGNKILEFEVANDCMYPLFKKGDRVSVKSATLNDLTKGDIIVYRMNKLLYAHRYLYKLQTRDNCFKLITKGDNAPSFDRHNVTCEELFGKVISIKKNSEVINFESAIWKINNYFLSLLSLLQACIVLYCYSIKKFLFGNKRLYFSPFIKKSIIFSSSTLLRFVASVFIFLSCLTCPKNIKTHW